jgi:hypothetical protein
LNAGYAVIITRHQTDSEQPADAFDDGDQDAHTAPEPLPAEPAPPSTAVLRSVGDHRRRLLPHEGRQTPEGATTTDLRITARGGYFYPAHRARATPVDSSDVTKARKGPEADTATSDRYPPMSRVVPLLAAGAVLAASVAVALSGVIATAGGRDQTWFHLPTIETFSASFPSVDIVNIQTATSPLYHLIVAAIMTVLHLSATGAQIVGSGFAALLAGVVTASVKCVRLGVDRLLIVAPLLLSAYFWQSALWLNTDAAALLFAACALLLLVRADSLLNFGLVGVFVAAAIGTRQTYAWILVPAALVSYLCVQGNSNRFRSMALSCAPGTFTLVLLVALWHGFTPPLFKELNGISVNGASISYGFAMLAVLGLPVLLATGRFLSRTTFRTGVVVGLFAALPGVIFASSRTAGDSRNGGWLWAAVGIGPSFENRSVLLVVLAVVGGIVGTALLAGLDTRIAVVVSSSFLGNLIVFTFGTRLYQRYFELLLLFLLLLVTREIAKRGGFARRSPLVGLLLFQAVLLCGMVVYPISKVLVST